MARQNKDGKFVISAGEVGQFAVCPESWRLRMVEKVDEESTKRMSDGERLHYLWSKNIDRAAHLGQGLRFLIALIVTTIVIVIAY